MKLVKTLYLSKQKGTNLWVFWLLYSYNCFWKKDHWCLSRMHLKIFLKNQKKVNHYSNLKYQYFFV